MRVVFIFGPAAAGKYTIGSLLSESEGIPLFHNHLAVDFALQYFEFGSVPFCKLRAKIWKSFFSTAAEAGTSFIFTFHPEASVAPELVQQLQQIIEENGSDVQYIELVCPESEVKARLGNPDRRKFGKLQDPGLYEKLRISGQLQYPHMPKAQLSINTHEFSAAEAAAMISKYLRSLH